MNLKLFLTFITLTFSSLLFGQVNERDMYQLAYNYLNDSIIQSNFGDAKSLRNDCKRTVKGVRLRFEDDLQVANKFIRNDWGFPLCDLLKQKYKITESCVHALGSGRFELTNQVRDSLDNFWTNYEMKSQIEIMNSLDGLISARKDGFQVFFSDVYNNTIAAEFKAFCLPYDEIAWFGSSTSYFFIFNEQGEIEQVYSGTSMHYN